MTPKEKARELIGKFNEIHTLNNYEAKQCALIAVDELIKENYPTDIKRCEFWQEVRTEIEKL